jgi:putative sigma-54 modulation protein
MKLEFIGKGIQVSDETKSYVEHKLSGFEKHLSDSGEGEVEVVVTLAFHKHRQRHRADIDVYLKTPGGGTLHAWEESNEMHMSLDLVIDDIQKQLDRLNEKRQETKKRIAREKAKRRLADVKPPKISELVTDEKIPVLKPITVEEAMIILNDENRFFLAFRNAETESLNIIYRKKNGQYGLISDY